MTHPHTWHGDLRLVTGANQQQLCLIIVELEEVSPHPGADVTTTELQPIHTSIELCLDWLHKSEELRVVGKEMVLWAVIPRTVSYQAPWL